jgi:hypothetical protein
MNALVETRGGRPGLSFREVTIVAPLDQTETAAK